MNNQRSGVLTSTSEFEVDDASRRDEITQEVNSLLEQFVPAHPQLIRAIAAPGRDGTTIVLEVEIAGRSFGEADRIATNLISSLMEFLSRRSEYNSGTAAPMEQTSQTLIPA